MQVALIKILIKIFFLGIYDLKSEKEKKNFFIYLHI
jgi:hypothetical protein